MYPEIRFNLALKSERVTVFFSLVYMGHSV